jgi:hypothetical protein
MAALGANFLSHGSRLPRMLDAALAMEAPTTFGGELTEHRVHGHRRGPWWSTVGLCNPASRDPIRESGDKVFGSAVVSKTGFFSNTTPMISSPATTTFSMSTTSSVACLSPTTITTMVPPLHT